MTTQEDVEHTIIDDGGLLHQVQRTDRGALTGVARVFGIVEIDGQRYRYDRDVRVSLTRDDDDTATED